MHLSSYFPPPFWLSASPTFSSPNPVFPGSADRTIDKEAVKSEALWLTFPRASHAWRPTTGYRETLCVQQCGSVTRTTAAIRTHGRQREAT